jgi:hypothetical protein
MKDMEDQFEVNFHKGSELSNHTNDLANLQFTEELIVNFLKKDSLSNDDNIEDPEEPFEVTQYLE